MKVEAAEHTAFRNVAEQDASAARERQRGLEELVERIQNEAAGHSTSRAGAEEASAQALADLSHAREQLKSFQSQAEELNVAKLELERTHEEQCLEAAKLREALEKAKSEVRSRKQALENSKAAQLLGNADREKEREQFVREELGKRDVEITSKDNTIKQLEDRVNALRTQVSNVGTLTETPVGRAAVPIVAVLSNLAGRFGCIPEARPPMPSTSGPSRASLRRAATRTSISAPAAAPDSTDIKAFGQHLAATLTANPVRTAGGIEDLPTVVGH
jgi:hypothetical protein